MYISGETLSGTMNSISIVCLCSCDRRTKGKIIKIAVAVGIEIEFFRCVRHIEIAFAKFIDARV